MVETYEVDGSRFQTASNPGKFLDWDLGSLHTFCLPPQGLSGVPLGPHGLRPVGFFFGPNPAVLPDNPVDRREEGGVLSNLPPRAALRGSPGPHGLRPVGFFFCGSARWRIG